MDLTPSAVWTLVAGALVLFMIPGLALFYGAMSRAKSTLNMMMMVVGGMLVAAVVWALWGYSTASGTSVAGLFGRPFEHIALAGLAPGPDLLAAGFSATFAMITVGIIAGGVAERMRFTAWLVFAAAWSSLVYFPLAHMVWGGGLLSAEGFIGSRLGEAIDFAGGTVVHISAGAAAWVLVLFIGPRRGFGEDRSQRPHSLPLVMLGSGILWFGWFGFNAGAATSVEVAALTWVNTLLAPAAAGLTWLAVERVRDGRPTSLGAASGIVAGLVSITPACASVSPLGALGLGAVAGVASALAVGLKYRYAFDDSLDVVGVHLVSGVLGTLAIGVIGTGTGGQAPGLLHGGDARQLLAQAVSVLVAMALSAGVTALLAAGLKLALGLRASLDAEVQGLDLTEHAETAYDLGGYVTGPAALPLPTTTAPAGVSPAGGST
ncbi:ammonium transporter [Falsarthrobacter nasiphocae]|uniref:Ammonium transporter n=1 Tax=Falsarthrobacter nasiphocae TaxID=189863 RepID=A0AAE4C6R7_9MICC|nr:ammonium transporter [Falsarthrobacter nasiphocae]MDR6892868.1 Amt family ammonium transporter [Falsarthrobacter nasiphocae]